MGVGDVKWDKYGRDFLNEIRKYCDRNGLSTRTGLKQSSRGRKVRTRRGQDGRSTFDISLEMFRAGKSIDDIARTRGLTTSTIESHLALFIAEGKVRLEEIIPESKIEPIRAAVLKHGSDALGPIKAELGEEYSYGQIRAVVASME